MAANGPDGRWLIGERAALVALAVACIWGSANAAHSNWRLAHDRSENACLDPYRWFLVSLGRPAVAAKGQIVTFETSGIALYKDGTLFTKQVLAGAGALVRATPEGVEVDGRFLPYTERAIKRLAAAGAPLARDQSHVYRVRDGEIFVIGTNPLSYDSRYYGPVPVSSVIGTARALW